MKAHAQDYALNQTFQNDLGTIGQSIKKVAQWGPLFFWFPYMKTPMNLAKYSWNRTPGLQLISETLYTDILAGGARADMAIGRLTMSNMMAMFWFGLHRQGVISDGGPIEPGLGAHGSMIISRIRFAVKTAPGIKSRRWNRPRPEFI